MVNSAMSSHQYYGECHRAVGSQRVGTLIISNLPAQLLPCQLREQAPVNGGNRAYASIWISDVTSPLLLLR